MDSPVARYLAVRNLVAAHNLVGRNLVDILVGCIPVAIDRIGCNSAGWYKLVVAVERAVVEPVASTDSTATAIVVAIAYGSQNHLELWMAWLTGPLVVLFVAMLGAAATSYLENYYFGFGLVCFALAAKLVRHWLASFATCHPGSIATIRFRLFVSVVVLCRD